MISDRWNDYLQNEILKSGECLEDDAIHHTGFELEIPVIRKTARLLRRVALLQVAGSNQKLTDVPDQLLKVFHSPLVKKNLEQLQPYISQERDIIGYLHQGLLIKETRYKADERTVDSVYYRMGLSLYEHLLARDRAKVNEAHKQVADWLLSWERAKEQTVIHCEASTEKLQAFLTLQNYLDDIALRCHMVSDLQQLEVLESSLTVHPEWKWRFKKNLLFAEFLVAFYQLLPRTAFDFKEIGAAYFRAIGGSKVFDTYKKDFLEKLEELVGCPLHILGVVSLGAITPIFFSGELEGQKKGSADRVYYPYGSVHATTDLAVYHYHFQTTARTIWLTENRAIITRMSAESDFLQQTQSLIIGVDGQVRSGHRKLIEQLVARSQSLKEIIVWHDFDPAGYQIGQTIWQLLSPFTHCKIKWIVPTELETGKKTVISTWNEYEKHMQSYLLTQRMEQEEQAGGSDEWRIWMEN
ncbi:DUF2399 domain-containing protein [Tumebacillus permanentifrigoris]|uniref:Uncharacterized protein DUF2399 n=1 Tax=Tumebacillus permanentifrigoris TaxID=378543 RepID=A0A316DPD9_9BACL|nr:DUF2399 domain-containing protein [Tumebacillus permanentifrigoris]PWK03965.1 uncharacterized protein DUF2399 [Tumebacillus permanentifrigoris]